MWSLIIKQRLWKCFFPIMTEIRPKKNNIYLFWLIQQMVLPIYPIYFIKKIVNSDKIAICSHLTHTKLSWHPHFIGVFIKLKWMLSLLNIFDQKMCVLGRTRGWRGELEAEGEGGSACAFPLAAHSHHHPPPPDEAIRYPRPATQGAI